MKFARVPAPRTPPLGMSQCGFAQLLNPWTGRYEWKEAWY